MIFHDAEMGKRIWDLKDFGIHGSESVEAVGANAKMNESREKLAQLLAFLDADRSFRK